MPSGTQPSSGRKLEVWGLTGGIASGKSTVSKIFARKGIPTLDADQVAKELSLPGGIAHQEILKVFGTTDRAILRERVFKNPEERKKLENLLHPLIAQETERRFGEILARYPASDEPLRIVYEAALLIETGRYRELNGLIVVEAPLEVRHARLIQRDAISEEHAKRIIAAQLTDAERREAAHVVLQNHGSEADLERQIDALLLQWETQSTD